MNATGSHAHDERISCVWEACHKGQNIFLPFSAVLHGISKSHSTFLKTEKTTFLDLRVFDVFCVFLIDFCGFFAGKVSCFFWTFSPKKCSDQCRMYCERAKASKHKLR